MKRRGVLLGTGAALTASTAGCLDRVLGFGIDVEFETVDAELRVDDSPEITIEDDIVTVRGTVQYGSSSCGTVELVHAEYEKSQQRLDVLVAAADDSSGLLSCTDDLVVTGYRVEVTVAGALRRVAATEHHVFGETYSTTVES